MFKCLPGHTIINFALLFIYLFFFFFQFEGINENLALKFVIKLTTEKKECDSHMIIPLGCY